MGAAQNSRDRRGRGSSAAAGDGRDGTVGPSDGASAAAAETAAETGKDCRKNIIFLSRF